MTRIVFALTLSLSLAGCKQSTTGPTNAPPGDALSAALSVCVEDTNHYRTMAGVAAVTRSLDIEAYAAIAAQADGLSGTPHGYASQNPPGGQWGENEILGLARTSSSVQTLVRRALLSFWDSPGHQAIMAGPSYTFVGCGIFVNGDRVTVVQHFR